MPAVLRYMGPDAVAMKARLKEVLNWDEDSFLRVFDLDGDGAVSGADEAALLAAGAKSELRLDEALAASHGAPFVGAAITASVIDLAVIGVPWCAIEGRFLAGNADHSSAARLWKDREARIERLRKDNGARLPGRGAPDPGASYAGVVTADVSFWQGGRY